MNIFGLRQQWPSVLVLVIPFVLLDGFLLVTDDRWVGELGWTIDWADGGLYLATSLLAGLSAYVASPYLRAGPLLSAGSRLGPLRVVGSLWVWMTALALAGHAAVVATALAVTASTMPTDAILPAAFGYAVLSTPLATACGIAFAALIRSVLSAPVALVTAYFASYATALGTLQLPLMVGGQFTTMVGLAYLPSTLADFGLRTVAFTLLLLAVGAAWFSPRRPPFVRVIGTVALVSVIGAAALLPPPADRIVVGSGHVDLICTDGSSRVCVAAGHTRQLPRLGVEVAAAVDVLRRAGVDVVARLDERWPGARVPVGHGVLNLPSSDLNALRFSSADYATAVTQPTDCDAYFAVTAQTEDLFRTQAALATWILGRLDPRAVPHDFSAAALVALPDAWAGQAYSDLRRCASTPATLRALPQ